MVLPCATVGPFRVQLHPPPLGIFLAADVAAALECGLFLCPVQWRVCPLRCAARYPLNRCRCSCAMCDSRERLAEGAVESAASQGGLDGASEG